MQPMTKANFKPSPELIQSAENLFLAMAVEQEIRPKVEAYETEILARHRFKPAAQYRDYVKDEAILSRKDSFLLGDDDAKVYFAECFAARDAAGLKVSKPQNCPLLEAECTRMEAQNAFIKALGAIKGLEAFAEKPHVLTIAQRDKVIDIGLRLVAPFVGNSKTILQRIMKDDPAPAAA